jgi:hypothetical protein
MRTLRIIFSIALAIGGTVPAMAYGLFGHIAAYTTGAVVAHEVERTLDRHEAHVNAGGVSADGRYAAVTPESGALPNPRLTPGATDPRVTQSNLRETVCRRGGYTRSVRPPESYTEPLKRRLIAEYGYSDRRMYDYELDHLIPLSVGGAPSDPRNLWPEAHHVIGGWGSYAKDRLELRLHDMLCRGEISLAQAQQAFAGNWIDAYRRYIGPTPNNTPMRWMRGEGKEAR